jgi:type VI protein secretion system component Hcp
MSNVLVMNLPGIQGLCTRPGFQGWVEAVSFRWGDFPNHWGGPVITGTNSIHVTKKYDTVSARLFGLCARGDLLPVMKLAIIHDEAKKAFTTIDLKNVIVSSYQVGGSPEGTPMESITFDGLVTKVLYL